MDRDPAYQLTKAVWYSLLGNRYLAAALTLGVAGLALGHASLALAAGSLAQTLSSGSLPTALKELPGLGGASPASLAYFGLGAAFVKASAGSLFAYCQERVAAGVATELRLSVVRRLLDVGLPLPAPRVLATLSVRVREAERAVASGVIAGARALVQLAPLIACLVWLSPVLALTGAFAAAPFAAAIAVFRARARSESEGAQRVAEDLERGVDELVRHSDLFRVYGAGERLLSALDLASERAARSSARVEARRTALSGANEVLAAAAILGVVSVMGRTGIATDAVLLPFVTVFFMAYRPLRDLGDARCWMVRGGVALRAVNTAAGSAAAEPSNVTARFDTARPPTVVAEDYGAVVGDGSTSFRLEPGEVVCLVGPTGSGKTTLLRALLGLEPERGTLLVDGTNLTSSRAGPSPRPFAWVPQEAPLITGTIPENVMLVGGDHEAAHRALRAVGAERLIEQAGRDIVGPGGRPLSGGERRLVAIARALTTELPVLLLDEPTEGLDRDATTAVLAAISSLRGARSVLIATHRPEVVAVADRIVRIGEASAGALAAE